MRIRFYAVARFLLSVLLLGIFLVAAGCGYSPEDRLADLVPGVPAKSRAVLLRGSDQEVREYYADAGHASVRLEFHDISKAARAGSPVDRELLISLMDRLGRVWQQEYGTFFGTYTARYYRTLNHETLDLIHQVELKRSKLRDDSSGSPDDKIQAFHEILATCETTNHIAAQVVVLSQIAQLESNRENYEVADELFSEALRRSEYIGYVGMICQNLGALSALSRKMGQDRRADDYLDRMSALAVSTRFAYHAARAETFRGLDAFHQGRLNAAYLHFHEARDLFKRFKGGGREILFVYQLVKFYSALECWNIVQGLAAEASNINWENVQQDDWILQVKLQSAMADAKAGLGDLAGALQLSEKNVEQIGRQPFPQEYAAIRHQYAGFLLQSGRFDDAVKFSEEGIDQAVADDLLELERSFRLTLVEALEGQGRIVEAVARLADVAMDLDDPEAMVAPDAKDEALLGMRLTRARHGDGPELAAAIVRMLRILQRRNLSSPPSSHTYLELQGFDEVRWFIHDLIAEDPALGYEFDMAWRGLTEVASRGRGLEAEARFNNATEAVKGWLAVRKAGRVRNSFENDDSHLVYVVTETEIIRWWRSAKEIERAVLPLKPKAMRTAVTTALAEIASPPPDEAAPVGRHAQEALHLLARELVPTHLVESWRNGESGQQRALLWISADDALTQIPFATFDLASGEQYTPLAEHADTAYLRFLRTKDDTGIPTKTEAVVVGDPAIAKDLKRKFPGLVPLPGAREEALAVSKVWGAATVLLGPDATKPAVLEHLVRAQRLYVAAHHERDQATPYIRFLPLAADPSITDLSDAFVEAADILALDLRGCIEVVLAGCGTGVPYVDGSRVAPGFGDSFLDAGVALVHQTLWNLDDRSETNGMVQSARDPFFASAAWQAGRSPRHPYAWGGHILTTTRIRPAD